MGILDQGDELELQQHFISKGNQNKEWGKNHGIMLNAYRVFDRRLTRAIGRPSIYGDLVNWGEDVQINLYGASKDRYQKAIESLSQTLDAYKNKGGELK